MSFTSNNLTGLDSSLVGTVDRNYWTFCFLWMSKTKISFCETCI